MVQDLSGTLSILAVLLGCSVLAGLMVGFLHQRSSGVRAFLLFLAVGSLIAALQIFHWHYAGWIVGLGAGLALGHYLWRARSKRRN